MRNKEFIEGIEQVSASQTGPCFLFLIQLIVLKCHFFIMYCVAIRIFPYTFSDFQAIIRTFMCM